MLLAGPLFVEARVAGGTQKLLAVKALNGAFVFFTLLTNSDSLVSQETLILRGSGHPLPRSMLLKVTL